MSYYIKTINATGIEEIHKFLSANHKLGGDHFTPSMLRAWAQEVEFSLSNGNDAGVEIKASDSVHGHTQTFTVSNIGIDAELVALDE